MKLNKPRSRVHISTSRWAECCQYLFRLISSFFLFFLPIWFSHLTQFHGVDTESKNSIAEHVCWDYNLVSVGDVGQLKGSISSNIVIPICSAFSPETQLWGLCQTVPWAGQWLLMLLSCLQRISLLVWQFAFCQFGIMFKSLALPLAPLFIIPFFFSPSLNFHSSGCPLCSAAVQEPKQVMFVVELGNGVSRIYPFNLAGDLRSAEKGSHSFSLEW